MTATTKAEQTALTLPQRAAVALGTAEHEIKLRELAQESCRILAITNADGREEAHRAAMNLRAARTTIEKTGKAAREDAQAFAKSVIAEEKRLVAIIGPEEQRVLALRDEWDAKIEAEKQAKIAAERARMERIKTEINNIASAPVRHVSSDAAKLATTIEFYEVMPITADTYEEFTDEAEKVRASTLEKLGEMHAKAVEAEAAEVARLAAIEAENKRIEAERAELARLRAEQAERERLAKIEADRIAAEQAAEAARLETARRAQEAELQQKRDAEAARVRAEQMERDRAAAEQQRQIEAQKAELEAQRAALAREQAEAQARIDAEAEQAREQAEAIELQARIDAEAEQARLQVIAAQEAVGARAVNATDGPSDEEIIGVIVATFMMTPTEVIDRLAAIDFAAERERYEAVAA